jgi:hypothetical protein
VVVAVVAAVAAAAAAAEVVAVLPVAAVEVAAVQPVAAQQLFAALVSVFAALVCRCAFFRRCFGCGCSGCGGCGGWGCGTCWIWTPAWGWINTCWSESTPAGEESRVASEPIGQIAAADEKK